MKRIKFCMALAVTLVLGATNQAVGQTVTKKATLKQLHPAFSTGRGMYAKYNAATSITFKFDEKEAYVIEFSGISISMNKVSVGDAKAPKKTKIETPKYQDKKVTAEDAVSFGRNVYLIARHIDKKTDKVTLLAYKVNLDNFSLDPSYKILDSFIDAKGESFGFAYESVGDDNLLIKRTISNRKEDYSKLFFLMFDNKMSKLWEHEVVAPGGKAYYVDDYYFKDENNMLLTCIEYPDGPRRSKKKGKPNYKYHLFYFTNKMESVKDFELDLKDQFITDISAAINNNNQIICSGFYSKKGFYTLTGCFYMSINTETKSVEKTSMKEFSNDFNISLMKKKAKRKAKRKSDDGEDVDAPEFDLRNLYFDESGNVLLIAEDHYVIQHCSSDPKTGARSCYYTYHYDDLIAVSIDKNGEIIWNTKIEKKLTFGMGVSESFVTINEKGKWVFIYNENLKNLQNANNEDDDDDDGSERSAGRKNSAPVIVILDEKGNFTKEVLMMPEGRKSVSVDHDFHIVMQDKGHIIKITNEDGTNYYRLDLKL